MEVSLLISVVVPVYNAEPYLKDCVDSILSQSNQNFELILVDDGSSDGSGALSDSFAESHTKIKVVHQKNSGANQARWKGVQVAGGEWITFVDADDTLPIYAIDNLLNKANSDTDIVIGKMDNRFLPYTMSLSDYRVNCITGEKIHTGPVCKLYRRDLFDAHVFDIPQEIVMGEDFVMNVRLAFNTSKSPAFVNKIVYNYRMNPNSIMHRHVHTIEHSERFLNCVITSIPVDEIDYYQKYVYFLKWKSLSLVVYDRPSDRTWKKSTLWNDFENDLKNHRIRLTLKQKMALLPWNELSKRIIYKLISWLS